MSDYNAKVVQQTPTHAQILYSTSILGTTFFMFMTFCLIGIYFQKNI